MTNRSQRTFEALETQLYTTIEANESLRHEVLRLRSAVREANLGHLRRRRGRERLQREMARLRTQLAFFMSYADETAIKSWAAHENAEIEHRRMAVGLPPKTPTPTRFERLLDEIAGYGASKLPPPVEEEVIEHPALSDKTGP
jgi:hypothetical protein